MAPAAAGGRARVTIQRARKRRVMELNVSDALGHVA